MAVVAVGALVGAGAAAAGVVTATTLATIATIGAVVTVVGLVTENEDLIKIGSFLGGMGAAGAMVAGAMSGASGTANTIAKGVAEAGGSPTYGAAMGGEELAAQIATGAGGYVPQYAAPEVASVAQAYPVQQPIVASQQAAAAAPPPGALWDVSDVAAAQQASTQASAQAGAQAAASMPGPAPTVTAFDAPPVNAYDMPPQLTASTPTSGYTMGLEEAAGAAKPQVGTKLGDKIWSANAFWEKLGQMGGWMEKHPMATYALMQTGGSILTNIQQQRLLEQRMRQEKREPLGPDGSGGPVYLSAPPAQARDAYVPEYGAQWQAGLISHARRA